MSTVIDVQEVDLTTTEPAAIKRRLYGLLLAKRFWDENKMAAGASGLNVALRGVTRGSRYIVQLVVTESVIVGPGY